MASVGASLGFGVLFGLALAAPPGPMNAVIAEESVLRGWFAGFKAGLGAMTADVCFFVLALFGVVAVIGSLPRLRAVMVGCGGILMLYFAYDALQSAFVDVDWDGTTSTGKGYWKALVLAITNPYQILFWLTVGIGLLQPGQVDILAHTPLVGELLVDVLVVETGTPALLVGFFLGIVIWIVLFPASLVVAGRRIDRFAPTIATLSAIVLASFGMLFLYEASGTLF